MLPGHRFVSSLQVLLILICVIVGLPVPLQPLPILFLNLMIDGAPAMSISAEVQGTKPYISTFISARHASQEGWQSSER